jgi:hypothetical protein
MALTDTATGTNLGNFETRLAATLNRIETDPEFAADLVAEHQGNPITLGPAVIDPEEWANKQVENAANAGDRWLKNVKRPRRDPIKAAIAAAPKRAEKVRQALEEGKWEKAMAKVDEDTMFAVIDALGAEHFRRGVRARKAKVLRVAKELQPMVAGLKKTIEDMPDVTDADREARMIAARRGMITIGKQRRGI